MLKNKKFGRYAISFCILGIVFMFFYSGLQNDQINIIQTFSAWNNTATQMPITVGNFVCIALTFVYGTCFIKYGVRKTLIPCIILSALGCVGIAAAGGLACTSGIEVAAAATSEVGNYTLYAISLFVIRCTCMCFQMSGFQLAASWFIRYRGRVLGIVTLGSPLFSVIGTSVMTSFIQKNLGGDYRPFYIGICVILVIIAVLTGVLLRDMPEDVGLYPDGTDTAPKSEANEDEVHLTVGQVLSMPKSWMLICNFGAFQFVINACMSSMAAWFISLYLNNADVVATGSMAGAVESLGAATLWVGQAVNWLSVGAILGIPMSFIFGVIDDKVGTPVASMILGITEFLPVIGLASQAKTVAATGSCNVPMLVLWGFGVACMTGGVPTMHPASMSFVFGRREYQSANRVIMAIQLVPSAFAATLTQWMIGKVGTGAWVMVACVVAFGIITTIPMMKMKDANAEDRG
jgi:MFS family permease